MDIRTKTVETKTDKIHVTEYYEEDVPMKLTKKITKRLALLPVESKEETFHPDGTVETVVNNKEQINKGTVTMKELLAEETKEPIFSIKIYADSIAYKAINIASWLLVIGLGALCVAKICGFELN